MHQKHAAHTLAIVLDRVEHHGSGIHGAGIDAHEGERADEGIVHDLEREAREGRLVFGCEDDDFRRMRLGGFDRGHVEGRGEKIDHTVQERLNTLVLERRAAQDRDEAESASALANAGLNLFNRRLMTFEIGFKKLLVFLHRHIDKLGVELLGLLLQIVGNVGLFVVGAEILFPPDETFHGDQIDDALEA